MADDETRARSILGEMQARLGQGPHVALGIQGGETTPELVRSAFLNLTKQFHPARFGRMSNETQRLSNEVFLGIKSAHETLLRSVGGTPRGVRMNASGALPVLGTDGQAKLRALGSTPPAQPQPQPRTVATTKQGVTPPFGVRVQHPQAALPNQLPNQRQGTPPPVARPGTPPHTPSPIPQTRPGIAGAARPPTPVTRDPDTTRGTGEWQPLAKPTGTATAFDERAEMKAVNAQLEAKNWGAAKSLLNGLAARVPTSKAYRALIAYTRGREAQAAGQNQDALNEFQRALQLDPDLQPAKSAMAEMLRPRR